ncbi:Fic family protein [Flavobacterium sp. 5]|uniref:Fic family protein n=1 Tax=Flavobacterium sp. 5 TaxID=2035199 RepID=UPI0035112398
MSSLKLNLGIKDFHQNTKNNKANAIAQLMIEVQNTYAKPLDESLLLHWHELLMNAEKGINARKYRSGTEPMQVISGSYGNFIVYYEAPPSKDLPNLMNHFFHWYQNFSKTEVGKIGEAMILSAITHLYFETLHPFEDDNGRIGRALVEKLDILIFISLSKVIEKNKAQYNSELKKALCDLHITDWIIYFFNILSEAVTDTKTVILFALKKTKFFEKFKNDLNERQLKAITKMMDQGEKGFQGGMTAKKYMSINKTSKATATRDLQELAESSAFIKIGARRSIAYQLNLE